MLCPEKPWRTPKEVQKTPRKGPKVFNEVPRRAQGDPKEILRRPQGGHKGSQKSYGDPKGSPKDSKCDPKDTKMSPTGFRSLRETTDQENLVKHVFFRRLVVPREAPKKPKDSKEAPESLQRGIKEGSRWTPEGPNRLPGGHKGPPKTLGDRKRLPK